MATMSSQATKSLTHSVTLQTSEKVMQSIVKLFVQLSTPNYSMPWQMKRQQQTFGSGFVIRDHRILTNAHVVAYQKSIRVRKHGDSRKYAAKVLYVGHECDIALITVQEEEFWQDLTPLEFGGIPMLEQDVVVVGFPTGGDNISVTRGVVSRVELQRYAHSGVELLAIQIDAAINAGNSGGPALQDGKVVGIAFEALDNAENIGYIIPTPTIQHFLADVGSNRRFSGFCHLGIKWQAIESDHMRAYYCMAVEDTGVLVSTVQKLSCSYGNIKRGDVLMTFDGNNIADDGTIPFRGQERILWDYLVHYKFPGDSVELTVLRAGKRMCLTIQLDLPHHLVPVQMYDRRPSYVVFCGLVFIGLSQPYMQHQYGKDWGRKAPIRLCDRILYGVQEEEGQEVIVLSQVLADELTAGYDHFANLQLYRVNGVPILNLHHLCDVLDALSQPHLITPPEEQPSLPTLKSSQVEGAGNEELLNETGEEMAAVLKSGKKHVVSARVSAYTSFESLDHILLDHTERSQSEDDEQGTQSGALTEVGTRHCHPLEDSTVSSDAWNSPSMPWAPRPSSLYSSPSQTPLILDRFNYAHFELDKDKVIVLSLLRSLRKRNELLRQYAISQARSSDLPPPP